MELTPFMSTSYKTKEIVFVTGNTNKFNETKRIFERLPNIKLVRSDIDLPEIQGTPEEIIIDKCCEAVKRINPAKYKDIYLNPKDQHKSIIVEDISLCFNALKGMPGPYIKWFLAKNSHETLYKMLDGFEDKSAYALCNYAYYNAADGTVVRFEGCINGTIVSPRGSDSFGWDCIFQPYLYNKTFGEMSTYDKDSISHRGIALAGLMSRIMENAKKD